MTDLGGPFELAMTAPVVQGQDCRSRRCVVSFVMPADVPATITGCARAWLR
ncbi:MAG TPA: hypothetical protein VFF32_00835 [Dermatophilaceae bacterium]|nr:hypothetical protein [Dermatophilaceae bacterium]